MQASIQKDNIASVLLLIIRFPSKYLAQFCILFIKRLFPFFRSGLTSVITRFNKNKHHFELISEKMVILCFCMFVASKFPNTVSFHQSILITQDKSGNFACLQNMSAAALLSSIPLIWACRGPRCQQLILKMQAERRWPE